ncbi:MAG: GNAT family N-acetyltransferase [Candidatus Hydrogenedentes bacterium]|nr:GNAT family N-acetyltransferase [Candidatus Hydrogenedentota bacterium]
MIAVRKYRDDDVPIIARLYYDTVIHVNARDYTPEQIKAWSPDVWPDSFWRERFQRAHRVFIAEIGTKIVGFSEYHADGHVDTFYVHHEHQGQGVGRRLMQCIEDEAARTGIEKLYLEASITGRPFFARMGFVVVGEMVKEYRGAVFRQALMEKRLYPDAKEPGAFA